MAKVMRNEALIEEALTRSVSAIHPSKDELKRTLLTTDKPLRIYLGVDPTGPNLHLGHLTNLLTLRRLQKLGHKIIFLIGDFTATIGDPTDKMAPRQALNPKQVVHNMRTFEEQISRIISFLGKNKAEIRFNSEWYKKKNWTLEKFITDLLGHFSVQNMIEREDFKNRLKENRTIQLQEFIYPLLQGYDGVELDANVEVGGNDQIFNMSIGRALRKAHSKRDDGKVSKGEKFFIATALLVNPITGKKLMNKSEGGLINLDDSPQDIFGKVMALDDASMFPVAEFSTEMPPERIRDLKKGVEQRRLNPKDVKAEIAEEVVKTIYNSTAAKKARENFEKVFSKKEISILSDFPMLHINPIKDKMLYNVIVKSGVVVTKSRARILIRQGSVHVVGKPPVKNPLAGAQFLQNGDVLKIGKRHFFRIKI